MPSQRDVLRDLVARFGMNEDKVVQEYAATEGRGEVKRKSNKNGVTQRLTPAHCGVTPFSRVGSNSRYVDEKH